VIRPAERPLHALRQRGVEYVEVRAMDLDPFEPIGIASSTARFLDIFLLHCLLSDSRKDDRAEIEEINRNKQAVASRGREPGLVLDRHGVKAPLVQWATDIVGGCGAIAAALDAAHGGHAYRDALAAVEAAIDAPHTLPSARELDEIRTQHDNSYAAFALARSLQARDEFRREPLPAAVLAEYQRVARDSLTKQAAIEDSDRIPFEAYRQRYLAPEALMPDPDEDPEADLGEVENAASV
jgi:glutamate--cysteine ligase